MPANQNHGGYAMSGGPPAVPARAGGIPRLPTAVARGMRAEEPARQAPPVRAASMDIPSPRDLGLGATTVAPVALDWADTHRQLDQIGAVRFEMVRLSAGGSRFSCWLRDGTSLRPVTGEGASEAEAVRLCLARARQARP